MAIAINPVLPVLASKEADSVAPDLTLEAGSVVNAQVLKVLSADLVRIAIASLSIDVQTEVPLQQGQNLQLAVSQTNDGIRLQLVGPGAEASDAVQLSPAAANVTTAPQAGATAPKAVLTPLERITITATAQHAAAVQGSQAPLFANLTAVAAANLPPKLQAAIAQVLAQQTGLTESLSGDTVKAGFQKSGVLLEATLAAGVTPASGSAPDLKAALIVLRQALTSLGAGDAAARPASTPLQQPALASAGTAPSIVPPGTPELEVQEILLPQARVPVA
ncbi:MAG TPA: flagellar hook-length control protein FliK, partial [Bradyrhizobium sp.]